LLQRLNNVNVQDLYTDLNGTIIFTTNGNTISVATERVDSPAPVQTAPEPTIKPAPEPSASTDTKIYIGNIIQKNSTYQRAVPCSLPKTKYNLTRGMKLLNKDTTHVDIANRKEGKI